MKIKYVLLCSNAFAKLQNTRETARHPVLMDDCPTCNDIARPYQSTEWFVISPSQGVQSMRVATRVVLLEKKVDMKYMQVNILRNIARMTKTGSDIRTE